MADEVALIERFVAGDEAAFAEVVARHEQGVVRHAHALLGDGDRARDVAQEAFIVAYEQRAQLRAPAAFAGWLRSIVRSCAARVRRAERAEPLEDGLESAASTPEASLQAGQQRELVAVAVADLPEHERVVVQLFYLAGSSQEEIATALGIPVNTVKTRLHSARARLGERMLALSSGKGAAPGTRVSLRFVQRVRLFCALDQRDLATMRLLLEASPSLVRELRRRHDELVANVRWGLTPLHLAARAGDVATVDLLLDHAADIEAANSGPDAPYGATPLYLAAAWGRTEAVARLLARGAKPEGTAGASPLTAAIVHDDHPEVARLLIAAGAQPSIFEAVALGDDARVEQLLSADPALANARLAVVPRADNPVAHSPLHVAARKDLTTIAQRLLDAGAELDARDAQQRTPVDQALAWGHGRVFRLLVARGAAPDPALAAQVGNVERARCMVQLLAHVFARELEPVRVLLAADPSLARAKLPTFWPNNYVGGTALHLTAWLDLRPFIDLLLEYGADIEARDERYGGTPASWAEENSQAGAAEYLRNAMARRR